MKTFTLKVPLRFLKSIAEDWPMMLVVVVGSRVVMVVPEVPGGLQPVPDHFLHSKDLASAVARIGES